MPGSESEEEMPGETCECLTLLHALSLGDLQRIWNRPRVATPAWMDPLETPTQKACSCCQLDVVKELLLQKMPRPNPTEQDIICHQRLELDVATGNGDLDTVEKMYTEHRTLFEQENSERCGLVLPVVRASNAGHRELTRYIFDRTPLKILMGEEGFWVTCLILDSIFYGFLDIVLDLFDKIKEDPEWSNQVPSLAATNHHAHQRSSPLRFLALKPEFFPSHCRLGLWRRLVYSCVDSTSENHWYQRLFWMILKCLPRWFGIKKIQELKGRHMKAQKLLKMLCEATPGMITNQSCKESVEEALLEAVENGNKEFFIEIIKSNPQLLWISQATSGRNLFHLAVEFRKENIFNLIYGLDNRKVTLLRSCDKKSNNILHIAARLTVADHLSKISGAALKMQREAHWFKEVKSLVSRREVVQKNKDKMTPRQVFEKSHENLRKEGEEWMKYTATACSFVAALIATVTFQAMFTVPGGSDETSGKPLLLWDLHFTAFVMTDTLAFFTSCTSVLIFLSILTARYSFDDFIVSLPRKMILGLTFLFVSIASMLVAFITSLSATMRQRPTLVIPMKPLASFPALLFLMLQYPLLKEMISSTYGKGLFQRDTKHWL